MDKESKNNAYGIFTFITGCLLALSLVADAQISGSGGHSVIVIMKNHALTGADAAHDRESLMSELNRVHATHIKTYQLVNSLTATVSDDELASLKGNPTVAEVISDFPIHHRPRHAHTAPHPAAASTGSPALNVIPGACGKNGRVLLEPEGLATTNTDSDDPAAQTARSLGLTGAGVKVGIMADGIDTNNVNFLHKDGTSAFVDYQDFSGDGPGAVTAGGEAFLDANAIAGQGIQTYDVNGFSAQADPSACNVRIEGVAPGAALVGLKIFSEVNYTTTSNYLQAIDYAVNVDHIDVLNESFDSSWFPDINALDAISIFNDAAISAGVTVVTGTGDAGSANSIGTPASDPLIIAAGASTTYRYYAQVNTGAARYFATGWLNDNVSSFSSAGFNQHGGTVTLLAPGDLAFSSCDASSTYTDCANDLGTPSIIQESGGTSLSSPLTAGAAALVIEAYRRAHAGSSPTPALVKQILTSTTTDLAAPASEQGSGLLNSYKAVLLAQSVNNGKPFSRAKPDCLTGGQPLLLSESALNAVGPAGKSYSWPVTITNPTAWGQFVHVQGRTFGPNESVQTGQVALVDGTSPQLVDDGGGQDNYQTFTFNIPVGADRLDASLAYPGNPANADPLVRMTLIDPKGRVAAYTFPQWVSNFGNVDVRKPIPGKWTGVIYGPLASLGGVNGTIPWQIATQRTVSFGSVSPANFVLFPGKSQTVTVTASTPPTPGDMSGSVVVTSSLGGYDRDAGIESNSIPITLRSLVNVASGGTFSGILTGGNGRTTDEGQIDYYQFQVDPGHMSITANVALTTDVGDSVGAYLINPDGQAVGYGQNSVNGTNTLQLTANTLNPMPGMWTLIVVFGSPIVGDVVSQPFSGSILFDEASVAAPTLPNSATTQLAAGTAVTIPVTVTNTGTAPQAYFIDARLNTSSPVPLALVGVASGSTFPIPNPYSNVPIWLVPTETSSLQAQATANVPVEFDFGPWTGDPDLFAPPTGASAGTYSAGVSFTPSGGAVTQGYWNAYPSEIGPYPASGEPSGTATMTAIATMKDFDPAVTSATGDLWLSSADASYSALAPVTVNPGQSSVINVTITPSGASGTVVSGNLYVDELVSAVPPYSQYTGNELAAIPYTYTIK